MHTCPLWPRAVDDDGAPVDYSYVASVSEGEKKRAEELRALHTRQEAGAVLRRHVPTMPPPVDEYGTRARRPMPQEETPKRGYNAAWRPAVRARTAAADAPTEPMQHVTSLVDAVKKDPFQVQVRRVSDDGEVEPAYSGYQRVEPPVPPQPDIPPVPPPETPPAPPARPLEEMPEWYRVAQQNSLPGIEQYHEETHRTGYRDRDGRISGPESVQRHNPYQHLTGNRAPDAASRAFGGAQVVASGTRQGRASQAASGRRTALPQERQVAMPMPAQSADTSRAYGAQEMASDMRQSGDTYTRPQQSDTSPRPRRATAYPSQPMPEEGEGLDAWRQDGNGYSAPPISAASRAYGAQEMASDMRQSGDAYARPQQSGNPPRPRRATAYPSQPMPEEGDGLDAWRQDGDGYSAPPISAASRAYGAQGMASDMRQNGDAYARSQQSGNPPRPRRATAYPSQPMPEGDAYPALERAYRTPAPYAAPCAPMPRQSAAAAPAPYDEETEAPRRLNIPWAGIVASVMALALVLLWITGMRARSQTEQVVQQRLLDRETLLARYELSYQNVIEQECRRYNLHPAFVAAIVRTESHFDPSATSSMGARGLMQLMNDTYEWIHDKLDDPAEKNFDRMYNAETNLRYGCWYINFLSELFRGDPVCVAAAYHTGQNWMKNILGNSSYSADGLTIAIDKIPDQSTRDYARKVVDAYAVFKQKYYAATQW